MNKTTGRHAGFRTRHTSNSANNNRLNPFLFALFCVQTGIILHMAFASQQQPAPQPKITIGTSGNVYISEPEGNRSLTIAPVAGGQ